MKHLAAFGILLMANFSLAEESGKQKSEVHRVTTVSPFPRGLEIVDGDLYILSRGRVRGAGGVSSDVDDKAGTIYKVDQSVAQPVSQGTISERVKNNGEVFALPTSPPFKLWDTSADPPYKDRETDRPYCGLRWHEGSKSFYICAFSGIDRPRTPGQRSFSKNLTDAILRYDTRTKEWSEVERHNIGAGGTYPHHHTDYNPPPHGWLNGPDNLLPVGDWLYAVAKDNSLMVRYDLSVYTENPNAGHAPSEWVLGIDVTTSNAGPLRLYGHSALAFEAPWLYLATRTSSHIVRMKMDEEGSPALPYEVELVARFDPYSHKTGQTADITDIAFDQEGRLYVVNAKPSRVHRFTPDPENIYDARNGNEKPWRNFADLTDNQSMKSENILIDGKTLYITSGDGYDFQYGAAGTVYKTTISN